MSDTSVGLISAAVSLVVALFATTWKNRADLIRVQREQEHGYAKALFDRRVEYYPQLYNLLSEYAKIIRANKQTPENLIAFKLAVDEWNSKHSLFFTKSTSKFSSKFRFLLGAIMRDGNAYGFSETDWEALRKLIGYFEDFLKAEIGIFVAKPVGDVGELKEAYGFIDNLIEQSTVKTAQIQASRVMPN